MLIIISKKNLYSRIRGYLLQSLFLYVIPNSKQPSRRICLLHDMFWHCLHTFLRKNKVTGSDIRQRDTLLAVGQESTDNRGTTEIS